MTDLQKHLSDKMSSALVVEDLEAKLVKLTVLVGGLLGLVGAQMLIACWHVSSQHNLRLSSFLYTPGVWLSIMRTSMSCVISQGLGWMQFLLYRMRSIWLPVRLCGIRWTYTRSMAMWSGFPQMKYLSSMEKMHFQKSMVNDTWIRLGLPVAHER